MLDPAVKRPSSVKFPSPIFIVVSEPRVAWPVNVIVPEELVVCKAPLLLIPFPFKVKFSLAIVIASVIFKLAPSATTVPPLDDPKEYWSDISRVPAFTVIIPSFWLAPPKTKVPLPDLVKLPESVMIPSKVIVLDDDTSIVPLPVNVIPLFVPKAKSFVALKVPPLKIILSASALPGVAPKLAELEILTVPFVIVVEPE